VGADTLVERALTCLVVDDDDAVRRALTGVLQHSGYFVIDVASGTEALAFLERQPVPLVLSDINMPGMDGVTLLKTIQERWPEVAVVVVSGVAEVDVAVRCLRSGALDYITKPFQLAEVHARIQQALDKRQLILQNRRYQSSLEDMVREQAGRIQEVFLGGIQSLAHALDAKDSYTHGHSARVAAYSEAIAKALGLSEREVGLIQLGAEVHDIGKIGIPEHILSKPDRLTDEEYDLLMQHPVIGARILETMLKHAPEALAIVRSHHEKYDGSGRPDGLSGDELSIHVRIVTVADSFDAMTTARPYRDACPTSYAFGELRRHVGRQFDPEVVRAFTATFPEHGTYPIATPDQVTVHRLHAVPDLGRLSS